MSEYRVHKAIATYMKAQYQNTVFTSDSSGIRLTIGNAIKMLALKSDDKIPDLFIFEARGGYHGLIIEIKESGKSPWRLDGTLRTDKHIQAQAKTLKKLNAVGYFACFGVGFDSIQAIIDKYMNQKQSIITKP